jgi:hypothetical protein
MAALTTLSLLLEVLLSYRVRARGIETDVVGRSGFRPRRRRSGLRSFVPTFDCLDREQLTRPDVGSP